MKKWTATHTHDGVTFDTKVIEADTYTDAVINFELAYPEENICDLEEAGVIN